MVKYDQAEGCCMGCDSTLSPFEDLPTCSYMLLHGGDALAVELQ